MRRHLEQAVKSAPPAASAGPWKLWAVLAGGLLVVGLWLVPGQTPGLFTPAAAQAEGTLTPPPSLPPLDPPASPVQLSVLDVVGKAALLLLLVYGLGQVISRLRLGRPASRPPAVPDLPAGDRVRVVEAMVLDPEEGTLYLLEVDGQTLLVGAANGNLRTLWAPAPEVTTAFEPVLTLETTPDSLESRSPHEPPRERPLAELGLGGPMRREADWARQRSQLINALLDAE
jgi:hypothetical protein